MTNLLAKLFDDGGWLIVGAGVAALGCPTSRPATDSADPPPTLTPRAGDVAVEVTDESCRDLGGRDDAFVELLCKVGGETVRVHVLLPRRKWSQIRARHAGAPAAVGSGR